MSLLERGDKEMECAECGSCFVEKVASEEQESDLHGFLSIDNNLGPVVAEGEGDVDAARESARDVRTRRARNAARMRGTQCGQRRSGRGGGKRASCASQRCARLGP